LDGPHTYIHAKTVVFYNTVFKINHLVIEKQVVITDNKSINCYVNNEILEPESVGLILQTNYEYSKTIWSN